MIWKTQDLLAWSCYLLQQCPCCVWLGHAPLATCLPCRIGPSWPPSPAGHLGSLAGPVSFSLGLSMQPMSSVRARTVASSPYLQFSAKCLPNSHCAAWTVASNVSYCKAWLSANYNYLYHGPGAQSLYHSWRVSAEPRTIS